MIEAKDRQQVAALGSFLAAACLAASCGSSGPTKAEFVAHADAICQRTDALQRAAKHKFWVLHPGVLGTSLYQLEALGWREDVVEYAVLPQVREEAKKLGKLTAPSGDEETVAVIVKALEKAVHEGEAKPVTLAHKDAVGPFGGAERLARAYGFKACADPL